MATKPSPLRLHAAAAELPAIAAELPPVRHSKDYRSVHWYGVDYTFTAGQASCIGDLWQAWLSGCPEIAGRTMLVEAGLNSDRLSVVFRGHPCWNRLVVAGSTKGAYKLQSPAAVLREAA